MQAAQPLSAPTRHQAIATTLPTTTLPEAVSDEELLARLRQGDEQAFGLLIDRHGGAMLRLAMSFVSTRAAAEEVVQDTWMAVFRRIHSFESRASLKTWIFRILVNRAITRRQRDQRTVPFSALVRDDDRRSDDALSMSLHDDQTFAFQSAAETPEHSLYRKQVRGMIEQGLQTLPERQRNVVALRDVQGWSSKDVCTSLEISEANQRVLLHRGRVKLRQAISAITQQA